jgi:hypothetical protein
MLGAMMTGEFLTGEFLAGGLVFSGLDLLSAGLTLAYVGRLLFEGVFTLSYQGGCSEVARPSLAGQHIMRRVR